MAEPRVSEARRFFRRRRRVVLPILLALTAVQFGTGVPTVTASGGGDGCQPMGRKSDITTVRHQGYFMWDAGANDVFAVEANILAYSPWVDYHKATHGNQDYESASSAWVMLSLSSNKNVYANYAQDGWVELPNGGRHDFVQWADPSAHMHNTYFPPAGINQSITYRTEFNPNDKLFRFYMSDHGNQSQVTVPLSQVGFTPNEGMASGETHSSEDQLAGGTGFNENFWWPEIATTRHGSYHLSDSLADFTDEWPGTYGKYPGDNYSNLYGINYFSIWDGACGH